MRKLFPVLLFFILSFPQIAQADFTLDLNSGWQFREANQPSQFQPAVVPGTIHTDLLAHGRIPDPFISTNEAKVQWVETKTWEYQTTFALDKKMRKEKHLLLQFDGLDTYAEVYLNGKLILTCEDMFAPYQVDIKDLAKKNNTLRIVFHPAAELIEKNRAAAAIKTYPGGDRVFIRKAQYQFGWDWGPRLVTCGIWKPVRIIGWSGMRLYDAVYKTTYLEKDTAFMTVDFMFQTDKAGPYFFSVAQNNIEIGRDFFSSVERTQPQHLKIEFKVPNPKLWWCNGLGEQHLYTFTLTTAYKKKSCSVATVTGIRKIEMSNDVDHDGSFAFRINDVAVYARGSNWIPSDNFLPRVQNAKISRQLTDMRDLNMNMVRVWGGGIYESDYFYSKCDSLGLMVWQDLPFACTMYPYEVLNKNNLLIHEVNSNVRRIASHPSISLWCGDNENNEGWYNWGWQKQFNYSTADSTKIYNEYFDYSLKFMGVIAKHDPFFPFVMSSPQNGWGRAKAYEQGDVHYWGVWWGMEPFTSYETHTGRFVSEFGFQGAPSLHTFSQMGADVSKWFADSTILVHQKHPTGYQTIETYMKRDYGITPNSFEDYVYLSQVMQKDAMSTAIEAQRRNMPRCMGSLFWQYNDCWPVTSWSVQDYYGRRKLAWYELKRLYAPVLVSIEETTDSVFVWVVNDSWRVLPCDLAVSWKDFAGKEKSTQKITVNAAPQSSQIYCRLSKQSLFEKLPADSGFLLARTSLLNRDGSFTQDVRVFRNPMDLKLPWVDVNQRVLQTLVASDPQIQLSCKAYASCVMLSCDDPTAEFSMNGFDILPGEKVIVEIRNATNPARAQNTMRIMTLNRISLAEKKELPWEMED